MILFCAPRLLTCQSPDNLSVNGRNRITLIKGKITAKLRDKKTSMPWSENTAQCLQPSYFYFYTIFKLFKDQGQGPRTKTRDQLNRCNKRERWRSGAMCHQGRRLHHRGKQRECLCPSTTWLKRWWLMCSSKIFRHGNKNTIFLVMVYSAPFTFVFKALNLF
jgi:hypothetical protein